MAACTLRSTIEHSASEQNFDAPVNLEDGTSGIFEAAAEALEKAKQDDALRQESIDSITSAATSENEGLPTPDAQKPGLQKAVSELMRQAEDAQQALSDAVLDMQDNLGSFSRNAVTAKLRWTNKIASAFKAKASNLLAWGHIYYGQNDRGLVQSDLAQQFNHMNARRMGLFESYISDIVPTFDDAASKLSRITGMTLQECREYIGHYGNFRHIILDDANQAQIRRWRKEYAAEKAKGENADIQRMQELNDQIEALEYWDEQSENVPEDLVSVGYTKGEAQVRMDEILSRVGDEGQEFLEAGADALTQLNEKLLREEVKIGRVTPEMIAALEENDFHYYVPLVSKSANIGGYLNDSSVYFPGAFHGRAGKTARPENAFSSSMARAKKTSGDVATHDGALMLANYARDNKGRIGTAQDNGLRIYALDRVNEASRGQDPLLSNWADRVKRDGGFVVDLPETDRAGNPITKKYLVGFDPDWAMKDLGITGHDLNQSLLYSGTLDPIDSRMARLTSGYGQLYTRFRPWFAPNNYIRDGLERVSHLSGTDFVSADGTVLSGARMIPSFLANQIRVAKTLLDIKRGNIDLDSKLGAYWQEYVREGGHQDYTWGSRGQQRKVASNMQAAETGGRDGSFDRQYLQGDDAANMRKLLAGATKENAQRLLSVLDGWNDYFNNIAPFAEYVTMREAGMDKLHAINGVLDSMDLSQKAPAGEKLRMLYPFVRPTVQSAAAVARTLGMSYDPRGYWRSGSYKGAFYTVGLFTALGGLKDAIMSQMGDDPDTGINRVYQLSLSQLSRFIPVGTGLSDGSYFSLQTGFGIPKLVNMAFWGWDRVQQGLITPDEFAGNMLMTFVQEMSPGNWPQFSPRDNPFQYVIQAFSPAYLQPVVEAATNTNAFGQDIKRYKAPEGVLKSDFGGSNVDKWAHDFARGMHKYFGIDAYPEQWQHAINEIVTGPLKLLQAVSSLFDSSHSIGAHQTEHYKNTHVDPILDALGFTMSFGYADDVARNLFYQKAKQLDKIIMDNRIKFSSNDKYQYRRGDSAGQEAFWRRQLDKAGIDRDTAEDIITYHRAMMELRKSNPEANEILRNEVMSSSSYEDLQRPFEEAEARKRAIYRDAVNSYNTLMPLRRN